MTTVRLPVQLNKRLAELSRRTSKSKSHHIKVALANYLKLLDIMQLRSAYIHQKKKRDSFVELRNLIVNKEVAKNKKV